MRNYLTFFVFLAVLRIVDWGMPLDFPASIDAAWCDEPAAAAGTADAASSVDQTKLIAPEVSNVRVAEKIVRDTHPESAFTPIFDGESFEGWNHGGNWVIEDEAFYRKSKGGSLTYTAADVPDDFELRFQWKVSEGCNSGVYYRPGQVEYQVLDNIGSPYGENARQAAASLFFCMAPSQDATLPVGQWNTARIICQGSVIEHWLNGKPVLSFDYQDPKWAWYRELLAARGGDLTGRGGQLWLQDHGQDVWFRNLRWREIPSDEVIIPEPDFVPMPVTGEALAKEQARVKAMLQAKGRTSK